MSSHGLLRCRTAILVCAALVFLSAGAGCRSVEPVLPTDASPYLVVLGVAQDAGYPQAGCEQSHCDAGWADPRNERLPVSLGIVDPEHAQHVLFEATPALPRQLQRLRVASADGHDLAGVFLTHAHIGHYTGLIYFGREAMGADQVPVYVMPRMRRFLETNGPWSQLVTLGNVSLITLGHGETRRVGRLGVTPLLVPHRDEFSETVGYRIDGPNRRVLFVPDIDKWSKWSLDLAEQIGRVDMAFLDATFYDTDELPGRNMAEIPHPFVVETMFQLQTLTRAEREKVWFIHFNHSNPLLRDDSEATHAVRARGFNLAREGLIFPL